MKHAYEISAEVKPLAGSALFGEAAGAFVYCYTPASGLREALDLAETYLQSEGYQVVDLTHCLRIDLDEWEPHDEDYPSRPDLEELLVSETNCLGPLLSYRLREV